MSAILNIQTPAGTALQVEKIAGGGAQMRLLSAPPVKRRAGSKVIGNTILSRNYCAKIAKFFKGAAGLLFASVTLLADEPKLNIETRGGTNCVVYVTGGTNGVQYWVRTNNDHTPNSTNWFDLKRLYSRDFVPSAEALVFDSSAPTNAASSKPKRFFKLGDALPD